jgi:DNA end-binding protein Ku
MPRAIWSGSISFGLVNVPVKLFSAVSQKDLSFHQLEEGTGARIRYKRVSEESGEEVGFDKIVKGYEIRKGEYVIVTNEELEAFDPEATHTIDIEEFVDLDEIDPVYFEKPYYLLPDERAGKPYRLLLEAMRESNKVALGRVVMRTKQYLAAIRPMGDVLCLETMNYPDEVVQPDKLGDLPTAKTDVSDRELKMAQQLIESLSAEFDPNRWHDERREKILELIERKAQGEDIVAAAAPEREATKVTDLMAALEASLAAAKSSREAPAKAPAKKASGAKKKKAS